MPKTLSGTYTAGGYTLSGASQGALNPVTVTGSIDLGASGAPGALYGQASAVWTVTNAGSITGDTAAGIALGGGGTVINNGGLSGHYGIRISSAAGSVTNTATINAAGAGTSAAATSAIGIWLTAGGTVANQSNARVSGLGWGVVIQGAGGTVNNAGSIGGVNDDGVYLTGGSVTNQTHGTISGGYGIVIKTGGTVVNAGTVTGGTSTGLESGVYLTNGGSLNNQAGGVLSGAYGVILHTGGTLTNAGTITGLTLGGAFLRSGLVTNQGTITGVWGVIIQGGTGSVVNSGVLVGTSEGGAYLTGGTLTNASGGVIDGITGVVIKTAAGTVVNSGQIEAVSTASYGVYLAPGFANRVVFNPGASFTGLVDGGDTVSTTNTIVSALELGAGSLLGTLSGLGSQFINFGQVTIDPGADWSMAGVNSLAAGATLLDQGTVTLNGAVLFDGAASTISGTTSAAAALTVTGSGGTWVESAPLTVGASGDGSVLITNFGSASALATASQAAITLGSAAGSDGSLEVSGAGSHLSAIGELTVGQSGGGQLRIDSAGTATTGGDSNAPSQGIDVGLGAGGSGDVTVTGTGSSLTNTGAFIVGDAGLGQVDIAAGATLSTSPGTVAGLAGVVIANSAAASGSAVEVNGAASRFAVTGLLDVGAAGSGALQISGGASVTAGSLDAAASAAAVAQISLSGSGSDLAVSGAATVADDGTGVLSVLGGATFSAASLTIGSLSASSGAVIVSGAGSVINLSGALNIGTALGSGDLTVGPGASVYASVVNLQGQVVLEGGLLDPTVQLIGQGQTAGGWGTIAAGDIVDEGVIQAGGGKPSQALLVLQGTVLGGALTVNGTPQSSANGLLWINAGGTLELAGPVLNAASSSFTDDLSPAGTYSVANSVVDVSFAGGSGELLLDDAAGFAGTIVSYQAGDSFVIAGGTLSDLGVSNGDTLTVADSGAAARAGGVDQLVFASDIAAAGFQIVDGDTVVAIGSAVEYTAGQTQCLAEGTAIATASGPVTVEKLAIGDLVATMEGGFEPAIWIGSRTIDCRAHPRPDSVWPVRVRAGAFGSATPSRDVFLSPDHAVFANGVLVPVRLLANGTSIAQVKRDQVRYFHVELPRHEVILAESLPVESYLDVGDRGDFLGGPEVRLYPDFAARLAPAAAGIWETRGAAPLVLLGPALAAARAMVLDDAAQTPAWRPAAALA